MNLGEVNQVGDWLYLHLFGAENGLAKAIGLYGVTFAAAVAAQLIFWDIHPDEVLKRVATTWPRLKKAPGAMPILLLQVMALGALLGYSIYAPSDTRQATLAGVGWYTALRSVRNKLEESEKEGPK